MVGRRDEPADADAPPPEDEGDPVRPPAEPDPAEEFGWGPMGLGAVEDDDAPATAMTGSMLTVAGLFAALTAVLAGLPPFTGFIGKFAMISGIIAETAWNGWLPPIAWALVLILLASGFAVLLSLVSFGISRFWVQFEDRPRVLVLEVAPVALIVIALVLISLRAEPAMRMAQKAADSLIEGRYAQVVMSVRPVDPALIPQVDTGDAAP